jgi:hypothetical protein
MKYYLLGLSVILLAGCNRAAKIEIEGAAPGIKSGTFIVKSGHDSTLFGVNIKDEKFQVSGILLRPGFFTMDITNDTSQASHDKHYEVYLEGGKYAIKTDAGKPFNYPQITTTSATQNELAAYNKLVDEQGADASIAAARLKHELENMKNTPHTPDKFNGLVNQLSIVQEQQRNSEFEALKQFSKQYPKSTITTHLMGEMDYESKPDAYYALFNTFSPEAKASQQGKQIGTRLGELIKLLPGALSPEIVGNTPDGKPFTKAAIKKKVILLDFWRASDEISRTDHQQMVSMLATDLKGQTDFAIVSVDFDSKPDWWAKAIKDDNMTWTQVSDLKGDDSPNAQHWAISRIPTYYLVDGNWKIISRNVQLSEVPDIAHKYLAKN